MNLVFVEPQNPLNVGAVGRTCVLTESSLHLVRPFGFSLNPKLLKGAAMDYWEKVDYKVYDDFEEFLNKNSGARFFLATTKAKKLYTDFLYEKDDFFLFGSESHGLSKEILEDFSDSQIRIPMTPSIKRSLNVATSAAIILYEALRQQKFLGYN